MNNTVNLTCAVYDYESCMHIMAVPLVNSNLSPFFVLLTIEQA